MRPSSRTAIFSLGLFLGTGLAQGDEYTDFVPVCVQALSDRGANNPRAFCECTAEASLRQGVSRRVMRHATNELARDSRYQIENKLMRLAITGCMVELQERAGEAAASSGEVRVDYQWELFIYEPGRERRRQLLAREGAYEVSFSNGRKCTIARTRVQRTGEDTKQTIKATRGLSCPGARVQLEGTRIDNQVGCVHSPDLSTRLDGETTFRLHDPATDTVFASLLVRCSVVPLP